MFKVFTVDLPLGNMFKEKPNTEFVVLILYFNNFSDFLV